MSDGPAVLLLDDGELDDVREALEELGVDFDQWTKSDLVASPPHPTHLLVATAAHAISARLRRSTVRTRDRAVWIAVATGNSRSQGSAILGAGFDYLVRRPVHPQTFASLLRRALYEGEERRLKRRVAVGYRITFRIGGRGATNEALLVDLSPGGCQLLARCDLSTGTEIELTFPAELTKAKPFSHRGAVTRSTAGSTTGAAGDEFCVGVRFLAFDEKSRDHMLGLLNALKSGPAVLPDSWAPAPAAAPAKQRAPRGVYDRRVPIFGLDSCVLVGRDLSVGGLRVDPHPALTIGATLRLALDGANGAEPVLVDARVIRDDGPNGVALHFDWVDPPSQARLRALVEALPVIEAPAENPAQRTGIVLMSVIPKILRRRQR